MGFQLKSCEALPESLAETNWDLEQSPDQAENLAQASADSNTVDVPVLRRAAMDFLARREHSFHELQLKLQRKFPDEPVSRLEQIIKELQEDGLQSDERFTESWVRYRQSRGFGYRHIRADLKERGVDTTLIDRFLFDDDDCWLQTAIDLTGKRLGKDERVAFGSSLHKKLQRYLESRGFGHREIQSALNPHITHN